MERLAARGVAPGLDVADVLARTDVVMMSLPSGKQVEHLATMPGGLLESVRAGQTIVDLGTTPVPLTHELAAKFKDRGKLPSPMRRSPGPARRPRRARSPSWSAARPRPSMPSALSWTASPRK